MNPPITPIEINTAPQAVVAMAKLVDDMKEQLSKLAGTHQALMRKVWYSSDYTPAEAFDALGVRARSVMDSAAANVQYIAAQAAAFGESLGTFLQPQDYTPPVAYTEHEDGTITID